MQRIKLACLCGGALLLLSGQARAYDLSRSYSDADQVERGFVVGQGGLWFPGLGPFNEYHQLSLEFGGEFGIRIASIRGEHNIFFVAGFTISAQQLDPYAVRDLDHRGTLMFLGWGGFRYVPGMLCMADGLGCPFVELRFGAVWEDADDRSGHTNGPSGEFTFLPGVGYRFRFGSSFQIGVRADLAVSGEYDEDTLAWMSLAGFIGFGW